MYNLVTNVYHRLAFVQGHRYAARYRDNAAQYNMILHTEIQWLGIT